MVRRVRHFETMLLFAVLLSAGCDDRGFEDGSKLLSLGYLGTGASTTLPGDGIPDSAQSFSSTTTTTFAAENICKIRIRLDRDALFGTVQYRIDDMALDGRPVLNARGMVDCKALGSDVNGTGLFTNCGAPLAGGGFICGHNSSPGFRGPQELVECAFATRSPCMSEDFDLLIQSFDDPLLRPFDRLPGDLLVSVVANREIGITTTTDAGVAVTTSSTSTTTSAIDAKRVFIDLDDDRAFGALQVRLEYGESLSRPVGTGGRDVQCRSEAPFTFMAFNDISTQSLVRIGMIASGLGLQGPSPVASCLFTGEPTIEDLVLTVEDVSGTSAQKIAKESVEVSLRVGGR